MGARDALVGAKLVVDGREITRAEDVFPFRAQWLSATDVIYTADGKIKRRRLLHH